MLERFKSYFGKLERLSDSELDRPAFALRASARPSRSLGVGWSAEKLVCAEKQNVAKLIAHIAEMSRRKVALELGYKSTLYLVRIEPKPVFEPSIRRRPARLVPVEPAPAEKPAAPPRELTLSERQLSPSSPNMLQPARPAVFNFRFSADRSFKEKFERLAEVMGVENSQKHMAEILERALDVALDKKDPKRKLERRKARQKITQATPRPEEMLEDVAPGAPRVKDEPARSRYIPSEAIERVHARGEHQCEYKSADGRRCRSRTGLQVDHERPFAIFRSHDEQFLRILCPPHNRLAAEHVYGAEFIQQKIDERRGRREVPEYRLPLPRAP